MIARALSLTLVVLLSGTASAQEAPSVPDSVWIAAEETGNVILAWTAVEGADAYRIWREVLVTSEVGEDGRLVEIDEPRWEVIKWIRVEGGGEGIVRATVPLLDNDPSRYAVSSIQILDDGQEIESAPAYTLGLWPVKWPTGVDLSAQPEAPAEVWIDRDSLHWAPVERAVGYQLYREIPVLDRDGELQTAWVEWGVLEADVLSINLQEHSLGDDDPHSTPWAVAAVHLIDGEEVESEPVHATPLEGPPTGLRPASWARIKENRRY